MSVLERSGLARILPDRLLRTAERARLLWSARRSVSPTALARGLRHRRSFGRLERALWYHRFASALFLGVRAGLFEALRERPRSTTELASALGLASDAADNLLRILESEGFVARRGERWERTAFAALALDGRGPTSQGAMVELMAAQAASLRELERGLRDGSVPRELDVYAGEGRYDAFLDAVNGFLFWAGRELLQRIELPDVRAFIVGSMGVSFSALVLEHRPEARVTYGCLDHLVREIPRLRATYEVPDERVRDTHVHAGEPEDDDWGDGTYDLVLLTRKMILQPEQRLGERFARKAREALRPGGMLLLWEAVHTDVGPSPLATALDAVYDLSASPTAPIRTAGSFRELLHDLGFEGVEVIRCLGGETSFVVARRAA